MDMGQKSFLVNSQNLKRNMGETGGDIQPPNVVSSYLQTGSRVTNKASWKLSQTYSLVSKLDRVISTPNGKKLQTAPQQDTILLCPLTTLCWLMNKGKGLASTFSRMKLNSILPASPPGSATRTAKSHQPPSKAKSYSFYRQSRSLQYF